ncbi:Succinate-semialdehyde dehydrogenase [NADP(+)] [Planctomycetes bacterium Poly30]|uniref:Succinate-semialdehyde dehydrogenase [NADP(+)] n=1 Tax=Saltatorellus ferox TaxID=2528018 RepID=A0A518EV86_9BACT|nr:Succinate-semialdehyde dehydrogenase [NADP(+)] [Planctomycetes bacterium Poly30]
MNSSSAPRLIQDLDPATGELIDSVPCAGEDEVRAAVARARAAQPSWAAVPIEERAAALERFGAALGKDAGALGQTLTAEMGKTLKSAVGEVRGYASGVEGDAEQVVAALRPIEYDTKGQHVTTVYEPLGVVAAITPWNFPVGMPLSILVPALVAGNSVVFKPSEHTPLVGRRLAELLQAELPDGVLELVQGDGETGAALVEADVDMIGFVGSRATGQAIMKAAAGSLKRLVLELGGKDPMVVFADADLNAAAKSAAENSLRNTGQVCCSVERVYVAEAIADAFEAKVLEYAREWTHGDGREDGVKMGPLVSERQRAVVAAQVDRAREEGAIVRLGGVTPEGRGWFYPATVLTGVQQSHAITHAETFGPVVAITRFSGEEDEAVRLANDTVYGLGANVWTGDPARGARVAARLRAGQVGVNRYLGGAPGTPWVGARQSGYGHLGGPDGHRQFTVPKTISIAR